jgi:DNA-binding SARP family transcriptional activator
MLDVLLLGPTEVRVSGTGIALSPLERNLLAVLALVKGTVVSTERIIESLWADRPPAAPRSRVQGLISTLRRKVGSALVTRHPGYVLEAGPTRVDLDECEELARQARAAPDRAEAARHLRRALDLWRGEPLDGVSAPGVEVDRVRLAELRLGLREEWFEAQLELGRHAEIVAELTAAVSAHPLRERLAGQLMVALYRAHRQADALRVYQALRERLADELGSDPSADLRALHGTILRGDPPGSAVEPGSAGPEPAEVRPAQLPASVGHFTGRDTELSALTRALNRPADEPRVLLVSGAGGIGKTALVVRWAHLVADRFPDGQIFVDLHGRARAGTVSAREALGMALGALGVARRELPDSTDERAALYRTLLSGRRVLVTADDADALDQLLALVPPTTTSLLVATSRRRLVALAAHHAVQALSVEPMSLAATRELLARIIGAQRLREPAAARVVQWCGGWPLATRLAGTRLAARPGQSLASFIEELDDLSDVEFDDDPRSVRSALASAYARLSPPAAHLFARLGLQRAASVSLAELARADEPSPRRLRRLLDELLAVHLVVEDGPDRYRVHEVVRRFARQCAADMFDHRRHDLDHLSGRPATNGRVADPQRI